MYRYGSVAVPLPTLLEDRLAPLRQPAPSRFVVGAVDFIIEWSLWKDECIEYAQDIIAKLMVLPLQHVLPVVAWTDASPLVKMGTHLIHKLETSPHSTFNRKRIDSAKTLNSLVQFMHQGVKRESVGNLQEVTERW